MKLKPILSITVFFTQKLQQTKFKLKKMKRIIERRLRMLDMLTSCTPLNTIVTDISREFRCSRRTVYNDYETRSTWMADILDLDNNPHFLGDIVNRHRTLIWNAVNLYTTSQNDSVRIAALKMARNLNLDLFKMIVPSDIEKRLTELEMSSQQSSTGRNTR